MNWNFILLEGYCGRNWDYHKKHHKYNYRWDGEGTFDINDMKKVKNPHYDPTVKKGKRPKYCERRVCYTCLAKECKHFCYCEGDYNDLIDSCVMWEV